MEFNDAIIKIAQEWADRTSSKMKVILNENNIISRSGRLYGSLFFSVTSSGSKISILPTNDPPPYAKYINWNGHDKWTIKSGKEKGRESKIPTNYTAPLKEFAVLKNALMKAMPGLIRENIKDITQEMGSKEIKIVL